MSRNVIAAAVAGVIVGAVATAVLMSGWGRALTAPAPLPLAPGIHADDVVAVLDAALPESGGATPPDASTPASESRPVDPSVPTISAAPSAARGDALDDLRSRRLTIPVSGIGPGQLQQTFTD